MMTEEEKKSAFEAAKARISKAAITLATTASALSPTAAEAKNFGNDTPPPAKVQTVSAAPSAELITDLPSEMPTITLHEELKTQAEESNKTLAEKTTELTNNQTNEDDEFKRTIFEKYASPSSVNRKEGEGVDGRVGNWGILNTTQDDYKFAKNQLSSNAKEMPSQPDKTVKHSEIKRNDMYSALAFYDPNSQITTMQKITPEKQNSALESIKKYGTTIDKEYAINNPVAQKSVFLHEQNHKIDYEYNDLLKLHLTPTNAARGQRLTETKSYAVEYLTTAHQYTLMKKQGIKEIQINGENRPLEDILEMYPGLKEAMPKDGFDPQNSEHIHNIVKASSENWNNTYYDTYTKYAYTDASNASYALASLPIATQLDLLKKEDQTYSEVSARMLQNTYIGNNTVVDLSSCRDLLDTQDKEAFIKEIQTMQQTNSPQTSTVNLISYEELKAVNDYLEAKGFTTDETKKQYLDTALNEIANRSKHQDTELKALLTSYNPTITYTDFIIETCQDNKRQIGYGTDIGMYDLAEAQQPIYDDLQFASLMPTIELNSLDNEQLHTELKEQSAAHNNELNKQISELTVQTPEKQAPQNDSTLALMQLKQKQQDGR